MSRDTEGKSQRHNQFVSRRRVLSTLGAAGAVGLAGCQGGDSTPMDGSTPTPTPTSGFEGFGTDTDTPTDGTPTDGTATSTPEDLAFVEGQEFRDLMALPPENVTFLAPYGHWNAFDTVYQSADGGYPGVVAQAMEVDPVWGRWDGGLYAWSIGGDDYPTMYEDFEVTNHMLRGVVRDDAYWSDGEPVTALDAIGRTLLQRISPLANHEQFLLPEDTDPANPWYTTLLQELELPGGTDGREFIFRSPFDMFDRGGKYLWRHFFMAARESGPQMPTHVEPLKSVYEEAYEIFRQGENGELQDGVPQLTPILQDHISESDFEAWREGDNVVNCGAWTLSEIRGNQEVVLEPNEHAPEEWRPNFERLVFGYADNEQRAKATAMSDEVDVFDQNLRPDEVEALSDSFEEFRFPGGGGGGLGVSHDHELFQHREVRAALMYALDKEAIAGNVHPTATDPITTPAGDLWYRETLLDDAWVNENLIDYSQDLERANALMEAAGFSKENGNWVNEDGESFSFILPTTSESPRFHTTVAQQMSDFGLETQVQTFDNATYSDKWDNGDFDIWPDPRFSTGFFNSPFTTWWIATSFALENYSFFPQDQIDAALEGYNHDVNRVAGNWSTWEPLTLELPPVGEPDAPESDYFELQPMYTRGRLTAIQDSEEDMELWRKYYWLANYFLPTIPIHNNLNQQFLDTTHWNWPTDHPMWEYFTISTDAPELNGQGRIAANPDNPEDGASVQE